MRKLKQEQIDRILEKNAKAMAQEMGWGETNRLFIVHLDDQMRFWIWKDSLAKASNWWFVRGLMEGEFGFEDPDAAEPETDDITIHHTWNGAEPKSSTTYAQRRRKYLVEIKRSKRRGGELR